MIDLERTAQLWGITGNLGGGKTLTAVQFAVESMRMGFFVCSNITLDIDRICLFYGEFCRTLYKRISLDDPLFDPFKLPTGSPRGSGGKKRVLVILDECAEWIDQYSSAKNPSIARFWSWLRHSSKRSQDVFIIVQRPDYLNKVVRILISRWIWVNDLAVYKLPYLRIRIPFCSGYVMRNIFDGSSRNRIGGISLASKSHWGMFYNTAECLNATGAELNYEYVVPTRPKSSHALLYFIYLFSLLSLCRAFFLVKSPAYARPDEVGPLSRLVK